MAALTAATVVDVVAAAVVVVAVCVCVCARAYVCGGDDGGGSSSSTHRRPNDVRIFFEIPCRKSIHNLANPFIDKRHVGVVRPASELLLCKRHEPTPR